MVMMEQGALHSGKLGDDEARRAHSGKLDDDGARRAAQRAEETRCRDYITERASDSILRRKEATVCALIYFYYFQAR